MITIIEIDYFSKKLKKLPINFIKLYEKQKSIFIINWLDSRLHVKKLIGERGYSFRVMRNYRVLFYFQDDQTAIFVDIGHRKDIYE